MTKRVIIKIAVLFASFLILTALLLVFYPFQDEVIDEQIYIPESTLTPTVTEEITPTETPEPTPAPSVLITEESYTFGDDSWYYESPELIISIEKTETDNCNVYIADILLSDMNQLKSGFAGQKLPPSSTKNVDEIAELYNSVLAVGGDYFTKSDNKYKSPVIKNGEVIREPIDYDFLAVLPDRLMIFKKSDEISVEILQKMEVYNTYTFGPILVYNGEIYPEVYTHRLKGNNPRCGVGQIDDNHLIVILVDPYDSSHGITLAQFAKLFYDNGATLAYNLDAGQTPSMVFMGVPINFTTEKEYDYQRKTADIIYFGESENSPDAEAFENQFAEE